MKAFSFMDEKKIYVILRRLNISSSCLSILKNYLEKFSTDYEVPRSRIPTPNEKTYMSGGQKKRTTLLKLLSW